MRIIVFTCALNWINQCYQQTNILRTFFWYFITMKNCVGFSFIKFYFSFKILFVVYRSTIKSFFKAIADVFQISLYPSNNSSFIITTHIYLVSSKTLLYALILENNIHKGLTFSPSLEPMKYLKILFTKRNLIINIYIVYGNRAFVLAKCIFFIICFIIFFIHFYIYFKNLFIIFII